METTCPDITVWRTYCDGLISANDRAVAESHLATCLKCRAQLISLFDTSAEQIVEPAPDYLKRQVVDFTVQETKKAFFASFRPLVPVALAAAIVLAVGISFLIYQDRTGTTPTSDLRQSNAGAGQFKLINPPNGSQLESGPIQFRWEDSTSDARYEFTLTDEKGDLVFQERNAKRPLRLDSAALKLSPQHTYYWSVTVQLPDGTRRESPVASFTIK